MGVAVERHVLVVLRRRRTHEVERLDHQVFDPHRGGVQSRFLQRADQGIAQANAGLKIELDEQCRSLDGLDSHGVRRARLLQRPENGFHATTPCELFTTPPRASIAPRTSFLVIVP